MFKEMTNNEMMIIDGGYTGWNERPENIDSERENEQLKITVCVGIPALLTCSFAGAVAVTLGAIAYSQWN
jgi:hypothetical protein